MRDKRYLASLRELQANPPTAPVILFLPLPTRYCEEVAYELLVPHACLAALTILYSFEKAHQAVLPTDSPGGRVQAAGWYIPSAAKSGHQLHQLESLNFQEVFLR